MYPGSEPRTRCTRGSPVPRLAPTVLRVRRLATRASVWATAWGPRVLQRGGFRLVMQQLPRELMRHRGYPGQPWGRGQERLTGQPGGAQTLHTQPGGRQAPGGTWTGHEGPELTGRDVGGHPSEKSAVEGGAGAGGAPGTGPGRDGAWLAWRPAWSGACATQRAAEGETRRGFRAVS